MFKNSVKVNKQVEIIDSCMGTSKTTNMLKWIDSKPNTRFLFVSPLLSEVEEGGRIHKDLNNVTFEVPTDENSTKSESFLELLKSGANIACTHSLYLSMSEKHMSEIANKSYCVIVDEEIDIIGGFDKYSESDLKWLIEKNDIEINEEDGMVVWIGAKDMIQPNHKYYEFLKYCESKSLYSTKRSSTMMVTQLPIKLFEVAERVIILTYMFDRNILDCFLRLKGFESKTFDEFECDKVDKQNIKRLLNIVPPTTKITDYSLSATWWNDANGVQIKQVQNFIETTGRNLGLCADDICWTLPKSRAVKQNNQGKILVKPKRFIRDSNKNPCYLSSNTRATNLYAHKTAMFHCYNRYPLQPVRSYLQDYGYPVDVDVFALSEMLQWLWRGCIRKNEPMTVAIGSKRMYKLFLSWLESKN